MSSKAFDNAWHSSSPTESKALVARLVISFAAVSIRIWCKIARKPQSRLYWDDLLILLALIVSTVAPAIIIWGLTKGAGALVAVMMKEGEFERVKQYLLANWIASNTDYFANTLVRLSILVFYDTIFSLESFFRQAAIGIGFTSICWTIAGFFGNVFMCTPVSYFWNRLQEGSCANFVLFFFIITIFETLLDTALLVLPIPYLIKLNLSKRMRAAVVGIFSIGIFAVITNIIRMRYLYQPKTHFMDTEKGVIWTSIHYCALFSCACLPLSKPLVIKIATMSRVISAYALSLLSSERRSDHSSSGSPNYTTRQGKVNNSSTSGEALRLEGYNSLESMRLDGRECANTSGAQGPSASHVPSKGTSDKAITVENEVEVSDVGNFISDDRGHD